MINQKLLILRSKSLRYIAFRIWFYVKRRLGILLKQFPTKPTSIKLLSLAEFKANKMKYFFSDRSSIRIEKRPSAELKDSFTRIINGDILFFGNEWYHLGYNFDWLTNPTTGYKYSKCHWSEIESLSAEAGDIKFVWEKSRFTYLFTVIRYDYHFNEDHSKFVIDQILNWIENNPINCGPNYMCSQEISIRLQAWLFAIHYYKNSRYLTETVWNTIIESIYWQVDHVYKNINYSRITVRNNHAITETLTLYLVGLLLPMLPNANKWKRNGKVWFEKEINYQIEPDGTYLQDSMNYHRVVIQLLTWGIALAEINGEWFQSCVYEKAYKSLNFLYQCQDEPTGWLPNYGANDGALFFPLSTSDFRDYRPQLDALHQILTGTPLYDTSFEDAQWIVDKGIKHYSFSPLKRQFGIVKFDVSGFYIIREKQALTFVRCGNFKKKGTTDQLHIDVWYRGKNILFDCGSYKYNTEYYLKKYFGGTESHNTVMLDDSDQMLKGPRFMWFYPHHTRKVSAVETNETYTLIGEIEVFRQLGNNIIVSRTIQKNKSKDEWIVTDKIKNKPQQMIFRQLWHTIDDEVNFESSGSLVKKKKFVSNYYGTISTCDQIEFDSENNIIITHISLK